jgi:hypothetical protein
MTTASEIIAEVRCDCEGRTPVVFELPDGQRFVTDVMSSTELDIQVWTRQVIARLKDLSSRDRLTIASKLRETLSGGRLVELTCPDCNGDGWVLRLWRDSSEVQVHA